MTPRWPVRIIALWCLTTSAATVLAQDEPTAIWDREIMPQPFDTQPFRQIKIPEWVQDTIGCGYTLSVMDSDGPRAARRRTA